MSRIWPVSFNKVFVEAVETGRKTQTIRKERKDGRVPAVGDMIHCYFGLRTKHTRLLHIGPIISVHEVVIRIPLKQVWIDGEIQGNDRSDKLAAADGFKDFEEMMAWWRRVHVGPRFTGFMIKWQGGI